LKGSLQRRKAAPKVNAEHVQSWSLAPTPTAPHAGHRSTLVCCRLRRSMAKRLSPPKAWQTKIFTRCKKRWPCAAVHNAVTALPDLSARWQPNSTVQNVPKTPRLPVTSTARMVLTCIRCPGIYVAVLATVPSRTPLMPSVSPPATTHWLPAVVNRLRHRLPQISLRLTLPVANSGAFVVRQH